MPPPLTAPKAPPPVAARHLAPHALPIESEVSADRLPPVTAAGVVLAKIVLGMVMGAILLLAGYLVAIDLTQGAGVAQAYDSLVTRAAAGGPDTAEQLRVLGDLAKQLGEQRAAFRAFWLQMAQLILLNLLLPLLTALLGYIFGTTQAVRARNTDD